jgi:hypothetical protein
MLTSVFNEVNIDESGYCEIIGMTERGILLFINGTDEKSAIFVFTIMVTFSKLRTRF